MKVWLNFGVLSLLSLTFVGCADSSDDLAGNGNPNTFASPTPDPDPVNPIDPIDPDPVTLSDCEKVYAKAAPALTVVNNGDTMKVSVPAAYLAKCFKLQLSSSLSVSSSAVATKWVDTKIPLKTAANGEVYVNLSVPHPSPSPSSLPNNQGALTTGLSASSLPTPAFYRLANSSGAAAVISENIAGMVPVGVLGGNIYQMKSNAMGAMHASDLIKGMKGNGLIELLRNGAIIDIPIKDGALGPTATDHVIANGEGFFLKNSLDTQMTLVGTVQTKVTLDLMNPAAQGPYEGFFLVGSGLPVAGKIESFGYVPQEDDTIFRIQNDKGTYSNYQYYPDSGGWSPSLGAMELGEGFYLKPANKKVHFSQSIK